MRTAAAMARPELVRVAAVCVYGALALACFVRAARGATPGDPNPRDWRDDFCGMPVVEYKACCPDVPEFFTYWDPPGEYDADRPYEGRFVFMNKGEGAIWFNVVVFSEKCPTNMTVAVMPHLFVVTYVFVCPGDYTVSVTAGDTLCFMTAPHKSYGPTTAEQRACRGMAAMLPHPPPAV